MPDVEIDRPDLNKVREALVEKYGAAILEVSYAHKELSFRVRKEDLLAILGFLKTDQGFNALNDMIGLDGGRGGRIGPHPRGSRCPGLCPGEQVRREGSSLDHPAPLGEGRKRFSVLYQLYRFPGFQRVRVVVDLGEGEAVDSIVPLYRSADWAEREIFDMFGIPFAGHQDLRRIYMSDEFVGHPLRKDFPLEGNEECLSKI